MKLYVMQLDVFWIRTWVVFEYISAILLTYICECVNYSDIELW